MALNTWQSILPDIIFVGGVKRSGKDFACDRLVEEAGFHKVHIVEPWLRKWCAEHDYDPDTWETVKFKERARIQADAAKSRESNPNVLIDWFREAAPTLSKPFAVTAVRFINEAMLGFELGALVLRVHTPDDIREERFRAAGDDLALMSDPFEKEVYQMPVHAEIPGIMPADWYVPAMASIYEVLLDQQLRARVAQLQGVNR